MRGHVRAFDFAANGRFGGLFEPGGGAPTVLVRDGDEAVFYGVLFHISEAGPVGGLEGDVAVPELIPDFTSGSVVGPVDRLGGMCSLARNLRRFSGFSGEAATK
jgi:hypothetical protein